MNPAVPVWPAVVVRLALLGALIIWLVSLTQPVALPSLNLSGGERLQCVSYAPYYKPGMSPFIAGQVVPPEQIDADLKALSPYAGCVRLYSVDQGLAEVLPVARKYGMKVLLGAWLGVEEKKNAVELDRAIALANQNTDVVRALIVGNEVLLRRDLTLPQLQAHIQYAKARAQVPVTYADVWEFWLRFDSLAPDVDFVTVHILPFWEDDPVHIDNAMNHVANIRAKVVAHFINKPILIGETGWPSAGRQREHSAPTLVNEARFMREFVARARQEGWDYNFIEAVDQPWKRILEGTVGGYWGFLDSHLLPKFSLTEPVAERQNISLPLTAALIGTCLCAAIAFATRRRASAATLSGLAGALAGVVLCLQWEHALQAYRDLREWGVLGAVSVGALCVPLLTAYAGGVLSPHAADSAGSRLKNGQGQPGDITSILRATLLFACTVGALWLLIDARYRDFPTWLYLIPALECALLPWLCRLPVSWSRGEIVCAICLLLAAIGRWLPEPLNPQALLWLAACLAFSLPALVPGWIGLRKHNQT